uniref:C2H2-type domain-containing protein n=1 Tax=Gopherus evgoodei TaxID=1825980 RepID=A0A8C5F1C6_9SAUR
MAWPRDRAGEVPRPAEIPAVPPAAMPGFHCSFCGRRFKSKAALASHFSQHLKLGPLGPLPAPQTPRDALPGGLRDRIHRPPPRGGGL